MKVVSLFLKPLKYIFNRIILYNYRISIPFKVHKLRNTKIIKVLFVISDLSLWKTEALYLKMKKHPRFDPLIGVCLLTADKPSESINKYQKLIKYLKEKNYEYTEIYGYDIKNLIKPHIIFYQQPYGGVIDNNLFFNVNKQSLFCHVSYAFNSLSSSWLSSIEYYHYCWKIFYENKISLQKYESRRPVFTRKGVITGLPFQDILMKEKGYFTDPWKKQDKQKKRIIWAPHHTIPGGSNFLEFSSFLEVSDIMLKIANDFKDEIQFAFKPHPFLKKKLYEKWGKEKTDEYYQSWIDLENGQYENGEYIGLFKYSDGMIHDCASYTIEYLYMDKPVMYLINGKPHLDSLNQMGQEAYNVHIFGQSEEDIRKFLHEIINGIDKQREKRNRFIKSFLNIPNSKSASSNIIDAILSK